VRSLRCCDHRDVAALERQNHWPRLHPRTLLNHDELAARELLLWFAQQPRELKREHVGIAGALVQGLVAICRNHSRVRQRARLACEPILREEHRELRRKQKALAHDLGPAICRRREAAIESLAQLLQERRQLARLQQVTRHGAAICRRTPDPSRGAVLLPSVG
jgi:hypothetical protein